MRITIIGLHFSEYSYRLANALALHYKVLLIAEESNFISELGTITPADKNKNLDLFFIKHSRSIFSVLKNTFSIWKKNKNFKPNVVHIQEAIWDYLILALPLLKKYPLVLTIHDPLPHSGEANLAGLRKRYHMYRWVLRRSCDAAITHGKILCDDVERLYPRLKGKVFSIPHGPLGLVDEQPNFNWTPGILLFFGRIQPYKGLIYFIEAVEELAKQGLKVKGLIAGRGTELEIHRKRMNTSGLFEIREGFIPSTDVPSIFHQSQVVVLPYTDGTQSGVAALAMGFARPVVASAVGSIPEIVSHTKSGLLVEAKNVHSLTSALSELLLDEKKCYKMGQEGLNICKTELSWESIAQKSFLVYKNI